MSDDTRPLQHPALGVLDARLAVERAGLAAAGGGAPLCASGPAGSVKQHEGAVVALTLLHAAVRAEPARHPAQVAEEALESWQHEHRARSGTAWSAYVDGGSRALSAALEELARPEAQSTRREGAQAATEVHAPGDRFGTHPPATPALGAGAASRWPRRRVLAAVGLAVVLGVVLLTRAAGAAGASVLTTATALAATMLASAALATFVPGSGPLRRLELGCGRCAAAGGLLAGAASWMAVSDPTQVGSATLAFGLGGIALVQRLSTPATCPTPTSAFGRPTTQVPGESLDESSLETPDRSSAER